MSITGWGGDVELSESESAGLKKLFFSGAIGLNESPVEVCNTDVSLDLAPDSSMKVFVSGDKVNFVDKNNVFLGYDLRQDCCEHADWFISDTIQHKICKREEDLPDLDGFVFDPNFFLQITDQAKFEDGGMVVFRIHGEGKEKYIHIFNAQNGYYGHGFEFSIKGTELRKGSL